MLTEAVRRVVPLAHVRRSGFLESVHHGALVVLDPEGRPVVSAGDVTGPVFPRSSNKPLQLVGMLRAGLDPAEALPGELAALAQSSHSGESFHLAGVRRILHAAGLTEAALRNAPDLPLDPAERTAWLGAGHGPTPLAQNCSGKHAAMLATCVARGWDQDDLPRRRPSAPGRADHDDRWAGRRGRRRRGGRRVRCARRRDQPVRPGPCLRRARHGDPATPEGVVAQANRTYPEYVGGTGRDVTRLIRGVPGLIAKDGAEGVYAAALPDGRAVALKIADGAERARPPVLAAALRCLGVEAAVLDELLEQSVVLGHGEPVGRVEPVDLAAYAVDEGRR